MMGLIFIVGFGFFWVSRWSRFLLVCFFFRVVLKVSSLCGFFGGD